MVLNKLFNKDKSPKYFFEADESQTATPEAEAQPKEEATAVVEETTQTTEASSAPAESAAPKASKAPKAPAAPTADVPYEVPEWVKAIKNYSQPETGDGARSQGNYAGTYVTNNISFSRRRPGPSLSKFKTIASQLRK